MDESDREEYEQQLDDLTEKEILLEIMTELKTIRWQNQQALGMGGENLYSADQEEPVSYECLRCGKQIQEDNLEDHAASEHGWTEAIGLNAVFDI